jgi:hypothetical protein
MIYLQEAKKDFFTIEDVVFGKVDPVYVRSNGEWLPDKVKHCWTQWELYIPGGWGDESFGPCSSKGRLVDYLSFVHRPPVVVTDHPQSMCWRVKLEPDQGELVFLLAAREFGRLVKDSLHIFDDFQGHCFECPNVGVALDTFRLQIAKSTEGLVEVEFE